MLTAIARYSLSLSSATHWIRYAPQAGVFVVGDAQAAWTVSPDGSSPVPVARGEHPLTLPIPEVLLADVLSLGWNAFRLPSMHTLIDATAHEPVSGDLLRHFVFLPDYGQLVEHPATGSWLALRCGRVARISPDGPFTVQAETRTRGKGALTFAAHPSEPLLFYGDNAGDFTQHALTPDGFGKATTLAKLERKASACLVRANGSRVLLGGMGYLQQVPVGAKAGANCGQCATTVRSLHAVDDRRVLVNAGMQGLAMVSCTDESLKVEARADLEAPVHQMAVTTDQRTIAVLHQGSGAVTLGTLL